MALWLAEGAKGPAITAGPVCPPVGTSWGKTHKIMAALGALVWFPSTGEMLGKELCGWLTCTTQAAIKAVWVFKPPTPG